jgi:hypothetical protein
VVKGCVKALLVDLKLTAPKFNEKFSLQVDFDEISMFACLFQSLQPV